MVHCCVQDINTFTGVFIHVKTTNELSFLSLQDEMEGLDLEGKRVETHRPMREAVQCSDSSPEGVCFNSIIKITV